MALTASKARHPTLNAALAGALAGTAILTRQNGGVVLTVILVGLFLASRSQRWQSAVKLPAVAACAAILVVLPWTIRNAVELHDFIPVATQTGLLLGGTYNADADGSDDLRGRWVPPSEVRPPAPCSRTPS